MCSGWLDPCGRSGCRLGWCRRSIPASVTCQVQVGRPPPMARILRFKPAWTLCGRVVPPCPGPRASGRDPQILDYDSMRAVSGSCKACRAGSPAIDFKDRRGFTHGAGGATFLHRVDLAEEQPLLPDRMAVRVDRLRNCCAREARQAVVSPPAGVTRNTVVALVSAS